MIFKKNSYICIMKTKLVKELSLLIENNITKDKYNIDDVEFIISDFIKYFPDDTDFKSEKFLDGIIKHIKIVNKLCGKIHL